MKNTLKKYSKSKSDKNSKEKKIKKNKKVPSCYCHDMKECIC